MVQIDMVFKLFAILQKYDFSSKSQPNLVIGFSVVSCLRYCKSTIFQANHNRKNNSVCSSVLFAILQKYDFSSKSQRACGRKNNQASCLRYCKSTIFQANHNQNTSVQQRCLVVCDTAKVRFFKQITTCLSTMADKMELFAILQKYDFSSKSQLLT